MIRRSVIFLFSICLVLTLGQGVAAACSVDSECDIERTCTKTDDGMTCVIKAKGETTVDDVRKCAREHVKTSPMHEGVSVKVEDIDGGVRVAMTATTADGIKTLQAHAEAGCEKVAKAEKGCDHHVKAVAVEKGCDHHAKVKKAEVSKGCPHEKEAAKAEVAKSEGCCSKGEKTAKADVEKSKGCCSKGTS